MAKDGQQQNQNRARDRRADVESLARDVFCRLAVMATGKTRESVAREALEAARAFYRACDETN